MKEILRNLKGAAGGVWPAARLVLGVFDTERARMLATSRGMMSLAIGLALFFALPQRPIVHQEVQSEASVLAPDYISDRDRLLYQSIFALGDRAGPEIVKETLGRIDNKILEGHTLATLYLGETYKPSQDELITWLANYSDHPQAARIRTLASAKGVDTRTLAEFDITAEVLRGDGYIDHIGKKPMPDSWYRGLSLWKENKHAQAAKIFADIGGDKKLSDWQRAAGYYWSARADEKLGNHFTARNELRNASAFSTTFYGLLAMQERGRTPELAAAAPHVPADIYHDANAVRARALAAIGELSMAENELRALGARLDTRDRAAIVTLASELNLANLQVRLSHLKYISDDEKIFAAYPMPTWLTQAQTRVDPALVLAIARQESVFREEVTSQAGAVGMMQMLPSTASMMMRDLKSGGVNLASANSDTLPMAEQLTNPQLNIRLGAEYVRHLMEQPTIGSSLVKVLASYNAGPGSVANWQKTSAAKITDPLLYIESIPYAETRNYVMQVMAQYWVYQSLMGESTASLASLAKGEWPGV